MPVHLRYRVPDVSIHLMLLFIMSDEEIKKQYTEFQYISCYSLSQMKQSDASAFVEFQYISCYSLSLWGPGAPPARQSFQYISCYSLSKQTNKDEWFRGVSIHLMLLFIIPSHSISLSSSMFQYISCYSLSELPPHLWRVLVPFQYISCYSLSRGTLKWAKRNKRFNTSHVTLYRRKHLSNTLQEDLFQYISCYSLSLSTPPEVKQRMSFQYISCYSLSKPHYFPNREMMCFNTSHVTLYLCNIIRQCCDANVSIHLMLLFIKHSFFVLLWQDIVSIHLMLLFIW